MNEQRIISEFKGSYRFLSNFYTDFIAGVPKIQFSIDGLDFICVEQWYVLNKCKNGPFDIELRSRDKHGRQYSEFVHISNSHEAIMRSTNSSHIKQFGRKCPIVENWESIKLDVMKRGVEAKFSQNNILRQKLVNTGNAILQEGNRWGDLFWGVNLDPEKGVVGEGLNHLGKILMDVRENLVKKIAEEN